MRRLVCLTTLALLVAALAAGQAAAARPTAAALRVQAQAYGDAALRFEADLSALAPRVPAVAGPRPAEALCGRSLTSGLSESVAVDVQTLALIGVLRREGRFLRPPVDALVARLRAVAAPDRILAEGARGWESIGATLRRFAALPRSGCPLIRRWARVGFRRSARPPLLDELATAVDPPGLGRFDRAERRLLQLGAKSRAARAFNPAILVTALSGGVSVR